MLDAVINLLFNSLFLGSIYALVGSSLTLLYGVASTCNLAEGDLMIVGSYLTYFLFVALGIIPLISILVVPLLLGILGLALYRVGGFSTVLRKDTTRMNKELSMAILTFALTLIIDNIIAKIFTTNYKTFSYFTDIIEIMGFRFMLNKLFTIIISLIFIAFLLVILKRTWFGLGIRCVLNDELAAGVVGIEIDKVYLFTFFISFAIAGMAGSLFSMNFYISPYLGGELTMIAFVIVILGGSGSIRGALLGGMIFAFLETIITFFLSPLIRIGIIYLVLILFLLVKPKGLFKGGT